MELNEYNLRGEKEKETEETEEEVDFSRVRFDVHTRIAGRNKGS